MDESLKRSLRRRAVKTTLKRVRLDHLSVLVDGQHNAAAFEPEFDCVVHSDHEDHDHGGTDRFEDVFSGGEDIDNGVGINNPDEHDHPAGDVDDRGCKSEPLCTHASPTPYEPPLAHPCDVNAAERVDLSGSEDTAGAGEEAEEQDEELVQSEASLSDSDSHDVSEYEHERPHFNSDREKEQYVIDSIRDWAQKPGLLSLTKLDDLLHLLSVVFPNMPLTYTTLFQCDYQFDISEFVSGGTFWYRGIRNYLKQLNMKDYLEKFKEITLDFGIDGLPLDKIKLWPLLGSLVGSDNEPFIIAVYKGLRDPTDVNEFMSRFITELKDLHENGYRYEGKVIKIIIRYYILDAVARQFLKCITSHGGYAGCERCTVDGDYIDNRMTFLDLDAPLRTDQSFRDKEQPQHHKGISPLEEVNTAMISQVLLDPMHMVWAGVVKRLLDFWINVIGAWKLHHEVIELISSVFEFLRPYCPTDFNRKPHDLTLRALNVLS
ncbi:Cytochrome c heme lyase [Frankliniella fusca]|uniref:Cytochrome c heme lyase n=1 Tax=Frankliniella fusca TaxID=407009 RepID=A0AAE1HUF1_9NEOP|nr:Cytochrome c heme lyase [Frankliniella fusca]